MRTGATHLEQVRAYRAALAAGVPVAVSRSEASGSTPELPDLPPVDPRAPTCLVFSPHPDDEAIAGALPLRLRRAHRWRVVNVAVTLGSLASRRAARWQEAQRSCTHLGFELVSATGEPACALERITRTDSRRDPLAWQRAVQAVAAMVQRHRPCLIVAPHALDGHPAHIGTHHLVLQALKAASPPWPVHLAWSEYWNTQLNPALMIEVDDLDAARMMGATALHAGEVVRHAYHHALPAWWIDGARRGAERVGGAGQPASAMAFAALYGWQRWQGQRRLRMHGRVVTAVDDLAACFGPAGAPAL